MTADNVYEAPAAVHATGRFIGKIALGLRAGVVACGMVFTFSLGATTVETVTDRDPGLCEAFSRMTNALSLPSLSGAQLCALRFASLPAVSTEPFGFTFPNWQVIHERDPVAKYIQLVEEHMNTAARETDTPKMRMDTQRDLARQGDEVAKLAAQGERQ